MIKQDTFHSLSPVTLKAKYYIFFVLSIVIIVPALAGKRYIWTTQLNSAFIINTSINIDINIHKSLLFHNKLYFSTASNFIEGPTFTQSYHYTLSESILTGTVVDTVIAFDPDGDALTYTIQTGNTNKTFQIDTVTGILRIAKQFNHHTQAQYTLTIKATDATGLSAETPVDITVVPTTTVSTFNSIIWETAASQPYVVNEAQGETVNNKLYIFGGFDSRKSGFTPTNRANVYDPVLNKWTALTPMPPMNGTTHGGVTHAGMTTDGTDIYFAGGYTSNTAGTGQIFGTKEVWKYIVAENRYERLPDLPVTIAAGQLEYLNGRLHHIGGTNRTRTQDLGDHYVLDLDNLATGWKTLAPLPNPRQHAGSAVHESKIYYIGGQTGHDEKLIAQKEVHAYDPITNTWTKKADLPVPAGSTGRGHISSAVIIVGNQILVLAGQTVHHSSGQSNLVSAYTPVTNIWENLTSLPQARFSGVAGLLNNSIFYTGGSRTSITFKSSPVLPPTQNLITNLTANTGGVYSIDELITGATIYTDRTYQVKGLPANLNKSLFLKTPNNDKDQSGNEVFSFELTKNATLYVAYDPRATILPAWLSDWQKLSDTLIINDPAIKTLLLYSKTIPAGKVSLAGNLTPPATGARSNYIVIIVPSITTGINQENKNKEAAIKVYPNPSHVGSETKIILTGFTAKKPLTVTLYDMVGHLIHTSQVTIDQVGTAQLDPTITQQLPIGLYLIRIQEINGKMQAKLLVK